MNGFTILLRSCAIERALACTSAASLALRRMRTVKIFAGRQVRQWEAMLHGSQAGVSMARHARSIAVDTNPL
jgi:hypothetical protein